MNLPYITKGLLGIGGYIREKPEHFLVEEIPLYDPSGEGNHLYVNITKKNLTTKEVQVKIAGLFGQSETLVGFAGLKDKNAVTTQTFSINLERLDKKFAEGIKEKIEENLPVTVNWTKLHKNKLRAGHLLGNKFEILVTGLDIDVKEALERASKIVDNLKSGGMPNFYGPQRFGIDGRNIEKGLRIIKGESKVQNKWMRKFLVSSYQSYLFNLYLTRRIELGKFGCLMEGDIAKKHETGGLFEVEDAEAEQPRFDKHEISFTGPIYGVKMWDAKKESGKLEDKVLGESEIAMENFEKLKIEGTRRLGRLIIPDLKADSKPEGILVTFTLPKGGFATTILREIMKSEWTSSTSTSPSHDRAKNNNHHQGENK
jgi:tRNA pseudouridine13 synthase